METDKAALAGDISAGFLFDRFKLNLEDGYRTEAAGPFYYSQHTEAKEVWAIPPFYSHQSDPDIQSAQDDFLYPLFTQIHYGQEHKWQFFQLINSISGEGTNDATKKQITVFPIYFQQRSTDTNEDYTAVFPFYGRLKHRFFRDEIYFILFPAYSQTRKRDVVTDNYFYPIVDVEHGDGLTGWQVWPFAGHEHKVVTTHTNGFGDVTIVGGRDHWFYLWPFYLSQNNGIGTDNPQTLRASIPFYVKIRSPQYDSTSVFWPLFASIDNRARKYHEWQGPWPFVIFTHGEGKQTSRIWPIFSQSRDATKEDDSYAWPIYIYTRFHSGSADQTRTRIAFYLYSRLALKNLETGKERIRLDMWPFFEWHRDYNGNERLQVIAPLEPAIPDNPGIERNWSPLWSVWRSESDGKTGANSQSFLWNLYRRSNGPDGKSISAMFGLYQYENKPGEKSLRLFYVPVTGGH
jgi:hypothetical protein